MSAEFDSRLPDFKSPFGAVRSGEPVHFFLRVYDAALSDAAAWGAELVVTPDGGRDIVITMSRRAAGDGFSCVFTPGVPGLYWYFFRLRRPGGSVFICRGRSSRSLECGFRGTPWQLTVFSPDFKTPAWIKGGVIYQIFPDRFRRGGPLPDAIPSGRTIRSDWGGTPSFAPDKNGEVRNDDFFGGDLRGITESLPYLSQLGVTAVYLNPIFESRSNHRYDTGDYMRIDPLLGRREDLIMLCSAARDLNISIILDGVFNHTGDDSVYFNKYGRYPSAGAYQSQSSPYYGWYDFQRWPDEYSSWWGIRTLPAVNESSGFSDFIAGPGGVIASWTECGVSGWRLDVADELTEPFLKKIRRTLKAARPDALLVGEVWEDASNKISYGERRHYFGGDELDSVMDYPLRSAVIDYLRGGDAAQLNETVMTLIENYPAQCVSVLMNILGTHDTERLITALTGEKSAGRGKDWQAAQQLTDAQYETGVRLVTLAAAMQFCLPGVPCIYYGDETGMQGYGDPFCRRCYPWDRGDERLTWWYSRLSRIRRDCPALCGGSYRCLEARGGFFCFMRESGRDRLVCAVNLTGARVEFRLPPGLGQFFPVDGLSCGPIGSSLSVPAGGCRIFATGTRALI